jgi:hypothetical protein
MGFARLCWLNVVPAVNLIQHIVFPPPGRRLCGVKEGRPFDSRTYICNSLVRRARLQTTSNGDVRAITHARPQRAGTEVQRAAPIMTASSEHAICSQDKHRGGGDDAPAHPRVAELIGTCSIRHRPSDSTNAPLWSRAILHSLCPLTFPRHVLYTAYAHPDNADNHTLWTIL